MIFVAYAIAILLPLGFVYLIYSQDLFGQGKFKFVLLAFAWGMAAFGLAYGTNTFVVYKWLLLSQLHMGSFEAAGLLPVFIAPVVEELLKSLLVIFFLRRRMTYFVDGAIYGFASGIAFSILENIFYLSNPMFRANILVAILRVFSTCLMHGAASALVGTAIGRLRYSRGINRPLSAVLGWALAIGLHMGFNQLVTVRSGAAPTLVPILGALGVGIGGAGLIVLFIRWGLAEQKRWIKETLGIGTGVSRVTRQEVAKVQQYEQVDELLTQIEEYFGEEKAAGVEVFLLKQAQLGIKRKARAMSHNLEEQRKLGVEIETLFQAMEQIRRKVGVYAMSFVREVLPAEVLEDLSGMIARRMEVQAARRQQEGGSTGSTLDEKLSRALEERVEQVAAADRPARRGLFDLVQDKQDEGVADQE